MRKQHGFSLVELITVIVILGAVSVGIATFMRNTLDIYVSVSTREQLLTETRFAIERMTRELRQAVPNSVRINGNSNQHCLEFVPANFITRYTNLPLQPANDNEVDILFPAYADQSPYPRQSSEYALVNPTSAQDVYDTSNNKLQLITACSDDGDGNCATFDDSDEIVQLTVSDSFADDSPSSRLYFLDRSINYCVLAGTLHRFTNDIVVNQAFASSAFPRLAVDVVNELSSNPGVAPGADDPFQFRTSASNGVVQLRLRFARGDEDITYNQEVQLGNQP